MTTERIIIYPKDVERITGKGYRYGCRLINIIKTHYKKDEHQFVTLKEFCNYTGISPEEVLGSLLT